MLSDGELCSVVLLHNEEINNPKEKEKTVLCLGIKTER